MKKYFIVIVVLFYACSNVLVHEQYADGLSISKAFIESALKGKYKNIYQYVNQDSVSIKLCQALQKQYFNLAEQDKIGFQKASIIVLKDSVVQGNSNFTMSCLVYYNTYKKTKQKIFAYKKENTSYYVINIDDSLVNHFFK